ncbi:hypothetical protein BGX28_010541, partial [Mortierella sp. GBA30]
PYIPKRRPSEDSELKGPLEFSPKSQQALVISAAVMWEVFCSDAIVFVDMYTVRISGRVITHGERRNGHPQLSRYESRKKGKTGNPGYLTWREKFQRTGLTVEKLEAHLNELTKAVEELEAKVKELRKAVGEKEAAESECVRQVTKEIRSDLMPLEARVRGLRQENYRFNKMFIARIYE